MGLPSCSYAALRCVYLGMTIDPWSVNISCMKSIQLLADWSERTVCLFHPLTSCLLARSSKILTQDKEHFARLAVDAVLRLKGSSNLESIHIIKKTGGTLKVMPPISY